MSSQEHKSGCASMRGSGGDDCDCPEDSDYEAKREGEESYYTKAHRMLDEAISKGRMHFLPFTNPNSHFVNDERLEEMEAVVDDLYAAIVCARRIRRIFKNRAMIARGGKDA